MFFTAAREFSFRTLAASLGNLLKKIAARLERKEEEGEEDDEEEEEDDEQGKNKKNKIAHTEPDESAKKQ